MSTILNLACTASAWCPVENPSTNYHGASQYALAGLSEGAKPYYTYLLLKFEELPDEYKYNAPAYAEYHITASKNLPSYSSYGVAFRALRETFDEETVTYDSVPMQVPGWYGVEMASGGAGDEALEWTAQTKNTTAALETNQCAVQALQSGAVAVYCSDAVSTGYMKAYTENEAVSGKRPYLSIAIGDDPAYIETVITSPERLTLYNTEEALEISWDLVFRDYAAVMPIVQTSAVIEWRVKGSESAWNTITVSGDVRSVTVPANTFPARDIEFWVKPTIIGYNVFDGYRTVGVRHFADGSPSGIAWIQQSYPDTPKPWTGSGNVSFFSQSLVPSATKLLLEFSPSYAAFAHKALDTAAIVFRTQIRPYSTQGVYLFFLGSSFDSETATWNTQPAAGRLRGSRAYDNKDNPNYYSIPEFNLSAMNFESGDVPSTTRGKSELALELLNSPGFRLEATFTHSTESPTNLNSFYISDPVKLRAFFLDLTVTSKPSATTNAAGYVNPHVAQAFRWEHIPDGDYWCVAGWTTASATLYWRQAGASTWNSVAAAAGSSEVILAAETLPAGSVEWYVTATDDQGTTASSETYTINTADTLHTATPVYPIDTTENGDAGIRFIWTDASDTGAAPTGADLQYSADQGATWTDFASPRSSATQYDAPGGGFPSGVLLWRVRSLNAEGTAGPWSEAVSFLCFAAPDPPILDSDGKPFLTVTWQSAGQRAYRVTVDGKTYGPYFGDGKSFTVPEYLSDGSHVVRVEVQNEYGLWNGAEITVTVSNIPGQPVILSGSFDRDAALRWTCEGATADFLIYRDDVQIGHSSGYSFTDRTVLDFHTWRVINRLPGGYYTASNTVSGTLCTEGLALALLSGGPWLDLTLSTNAIRTTAAAAGRSVVLRQFAGREYPDAEAAPYKTLQISFDVSWTPAQAAQARAFEGLIGEAVIFKEPGEEAFVGVLSAFQRSHSFPARSYIATVQRIHWREYVDADS